MNKIKYTKGKYATGGVTQNSQVIEHFLTDNKEVGTKNLSTHYDADTGVVRLKNYATIIAERDGSNVRLSTKKYSVTTSNIQNEVRREAKSMGLNIVDREMFADGGEIESKIKERLANASFELPLECIVYVPSTRDANAIIPKNEMQQRVKEVQKFLSNLFGGYSSANVDGGYVSSDKGLIQEDVVKVTAFATKDAIQKSMPKLVKRIQQWCNQWSQESMGFEFEGDLFYISKDSTFSNGGTMYGDGGELSIGTEIVGSKKLYFVYNAKSGKKSSYYDSEMEAKNQLNKMRNNLVRGMMYGDGGTAEEQNKHMILSQAKQVAHHVEELQEILAKDPTIDSWVVAKMQDVSTGLSNITHYLDGKSEYANGGQTKYKDLFENYEQQPRILQQVVQKWQNKIEQGLTDKQASQFLKDVERVGYTFDFDADGMPYALRLIGVRVNQVEGFEDDDEEVVDTFANGGEMNWQNQIVDFVRGVKHIKSSGRRGSYKYTEFMPYGKSLAAFRKEFNYPRKHSDGYFYEPFRNVDLGDGASYKLQIQVNDTFSDGGEIILGGGSMASVQDSIMANGAKLKSGKLTLGKLKSMIGEYNSEGRNFELRGAYNQLELWSNGNRIEAGSKEDIYRALVRYRFNPKYADGAELPEEIDFSTMTDEEIINFANTLSYYDRMDEGIEEEFDDVEDAKEYILLMEKGV